MYKVRDEKYISEKEFDKAVEHELDKLAEHCAKIMDDADDMASAYILGKIVCKILNSMSYNLFGKEND